MKTTHREPPGYSNPASRARVSRPLQGCAAGRAHHSGSQITNGRFATLCALPAFILALAIAGSTPLAAQKSVSAGTTTTFNGVPACDCSTNTTTRT